MHLEDAFVRTCGELHTSERSLLSDIRRRKVGAGGWGLVILFTRSSAAKTDVYGGHISPLCGVLCHPLVNDPHLQCCRTVKAPPPSSVHPCGWTSHSGVMAAARALGLICHLSPLSFDTVAGRQLAQLRETSQHKL